MNHVAVGLAILAPLVAVEVYIFWRYPDFRREFIAYWKPEAIARRMQAWADRQKERNAD